MQQSDLEETFNYLKSKNVDITKLVYELMTYSSDHFVFKKPGFKSLWVNRKIDDFTDKKITKEELKNKPCYQIFYDRDKPCENCAVEKSFKSGQPEETEMKIPKYDGEVYIMKAFPVYNRENELVGVFELRLNITERKRLTERLEYNNKKLNTFDTLVHEIKTPLNLINTSLQILENKVENDKLDKEKLKKYLNVINKNNLRLQKLANNILEINKINNGKYTPCLEKFNVVEIIKNIVESSKPYVNMNNKTITFNSTQADILICFDVFDLERVIINLISNAVKHTNDGNTIEVILSTQENTVIITVKDNGPGISRHKQLSIFKKYSQGNETTFRLCEGAGLGLFIVKSIIEANGGTISV